MITIGYNQVQEKHVTDGSGAASEAKKVYVGNKLAHVHVNDNTEFALRQTLNGYIHEDNDLYAKVRSIKGNTKVWNQLQPPASIAGSKTQNGVTYTNDGNGNVSVIGEASDYSSLEVRWRTGFFNGHSVLFKGCPKGGSTSSYCTYVSGEYDTGSGLILNRTTGDLNIQIQVYSGAVISTPIVFHPMIIDLTLIYGAGNEPTTVAEFEADFQKWFGRPIGAEPYDAGSLIPFQATGIKSTGFNLWDEEWELGIYNSAGDKEIHTTAIRSTNKIKVVPNTSYSVSLGQRYSSGLIIRAFTNSGVTTFVLSQRTSTFITPADCYEICLCTFSANNITTYNHDICINLSNPTLNGTYVPYKATTVPIPVTTLTGKKSGSSTSEVIFPDGMKSAGSVKDEVYVEDGKTYAVKRVGSVDLGTLNWNYNSTYARFLSIDSLAQLGIKQSMNIICPMYRTTNGVTPSIGDKIISATGLFLGIRDSSYTDATTFKAAMSGVMLYYELATPIVYEVDNYTLPLYYLANGTGTEEIVSTATSAPADMDIEYRLRQRVRLVDMGTPGVLWADSDIDITKPDGFCDSPFTYDKSFFSWGNVVGHNPISNTAFDYDWGGVNQAEPWYEGQVYGSTPGSTLTGNIPADAQYDAAKAILGGNWRMPSRDEYVNLFSVCKFLEADGSDMDTSKTDKRVDMPDGNGGTVKGIYIESTVTGNRLFFSCSGYGYGRSWVSRGSNGGYWSSTWNSASDARYLGFYSGGVNPQSSSNRCNGFAIRPVFPISQ